MTWCSWICRCPSSTTWTRPNKFSRNIRPAGARESSRRPRTPSTTAIGGLLNVSFGNTAELILALFVLAAAKPDVVKAQLTGAIIGNSLLGLGLAIVVGSIGNAADYVSAMYFARQNQMGLAVSITVGSTIQISLLVAPVLVIVSALMGTPMNLVFSSPLELIAIGAVVFAINAIAHDGETTWFEGVLLLAIYVLFGLAFYFV